VKNEGSIKNFELHDGFVVLSVNPKIYPLDLVYSASYLFMDRAFVLLGGIPSEEITVELKPKDKSLDLEVLARDFNDELVRQATWPSDTVRVEAPIDEPLGLPLEETCGQDKD
jgi:hypothetical protein